MQDRDEKKEEPTPYRVEVYGAGCPCCSAGKTYAVVGPDGEIAIGTFWEDEEMAEDIARYMNEAYLEGLRAALATISERAQ